MTKPEAILSDALALPRDARAKLALRLAESLDESVDEDAEDAWATEVARRVEALLAGTARTVSADDALSRARAALESRRA